MSETRAIQSENNLTVTAEERRQLLVEWNDTAVHYPPGLTIQRLFEAQAEKFPGATAVSFGNQSLTYGELNRRANQLARHLRKTGIGPDGLAGIYMERSLEMVVALLGVLKAGGAYLPLDPDYPPERIAFMINDAEPPVILTQSKIFNELPSSAAGVICLDTFGETLSLYSAENLPDMAGAENLAYVIYTSGSTGKPKGVMNTHKGICNRLLWMQDTYQIDYTDRVLQKTPFSFDVSVWEFFWPLITGAGMVLAKPGGHRDSAYLIELINHARITTIHFVPSMLQVFLEDPNAKSCTGLKRVICSGEALTPALQQRFFSMLEVQLHNLYGPTEAAVDVTYWECKRNSTVNIVPIGRPIANIQIYILDEMLRPVPVGVAGELHIGGVGLAKGYLKRPELTAAKFIPNPFGDDPEGRMYKTGDLARFLPDGNIEYLGRLDFQVKIHGFRIELGEIEAALEEHPLVHGAVVATHTTSAGDQELVAYITQASAQIPEKEELRRFLRGKLPEYMVPVWFITLKEFPLTPNGKIDRKALPAIEKNNLAGRIITPPRTSTEKELTAILAEMLQMDQISIHDNFLELGGHSLLANRMVLRINDLYQINLTLREFLTSGLTVATLANVVEEKIIQQADPDQVAAALAEMEQLSEEELIKLLKS